MWLPLEPDLSAGRDVAAAHAVTGSDFPWLQLLLTVANLFAVPLVTFVSVPLILLGMLLHLLPLAAVENAIWFAADKSLADSSGY